MSKIQEYLFSEYYIPLKIRINLGMVAYWAMLPSFPSLPSFLGKSSSAYCRPLSLWKFGWFPFMYPRNILNRHQGWILHFFTTGDKQALSELLPIDSWNRKQSRQNTWNSIRSMLWWFSSFQFNGIFMISSALEALIPNRYIYHVHSTPFNWNWRATQQKLSQ